MIRIDKNVNDADKVYSHLVHAVKPDARHTALLVKVACTASEIASYGLLLTAAGFAERVVRSGNGFEIAAPIEMTLQVVAKTERIEDQGGAGPCSQAISDLWHCVRVFRQLLRKKKGQRIRGLRGNSERTKLPEREHKTVLLHAGPEATQKPYL